MRCRPTSTLTIVLSCSLFLFSYSRHLTEVNVLPAQDESTNSIIYYIPRLIIRLRRSMVCDKDCRSEKAFKTKTKLTKMWQPRLSCQISAFAGAVSAVSVCVSASSAMTSANG